MKKLLLVLVSSVLLFGSVENDVDKSRFSHKNGVLIDHFAEMEWQDNNDAKTIFENWNYSKNYCSNLTLNAHSDWKLPNKDELKYAYMIKKRYNNIVHDNLYWSSTEVIDPYDFPKVSVVYFYGGDTGYNYKSGKGYVRCVRGREYSDLDNLKNKVESTRQNKINQKYKLLYENAMKENSINGYQKFIKAYPKAPQVKEAQQNIFKLAYNNVKENNNLVGYEWFIKKYPDAPQSKEAIRNIHRMAFTEAKRINSLSSYETFIIAYPYAQEVKDALTLSNQIQMNELFTMKSDEEKKARLLAVKIKKMTIRMRNSKNKAGYEMIINRMSNLLTEKYEATDASLRYYESKEFTDFVATFKDTMNEVKNIMNKINSNSSEISAYTKKILDISEQSFSDEKADRAMSAFKTEQHREWEKSMHFRDKGYN